MDVSEKQFKQDLKEKFAGDPIISTWENIPNVENGEEVILVGLVSDRVTLKDARRLPGKIDGVKIIYHYTGEIRVLLTNRHDPLIGGVSLGAVDITCGTYSGVVWDKETHQPYLLTNEHVVSDSDNMDPEHPPIDWPILQPGVYDGGKYPKDIAGKLYKVGGMKEAALIDESCDIDAALVIPEREFLSEKYWGVGRVASKEHVIPKVGDRILKIGRTTGATQTIISAIDVSANISGLRWADPVQMEGLIQTKEAFVEPGDSGSRVWRLDEFAPIGIVFAGSYRTSLIIPAQTVCDKLGVYYGKNEEGGEKMNKAPWFKASVWSAGLYVVFALLNHFLALGINAEYLIALLLPILAIIFGEKWVEVELIKLEALKLELRLRKME